MIATRETEDAFVVTVTDDGIGFDPTREPPDDKTHIGLENVRARLLRQVGGTLRVESVPGSGNKATITIPKRGS